MVDTLTEPEKELRGLLMQKENLERRLKNVLFARLSGTERADLNREIRYIEDRIEALKTRKSQEDSRALHDWLNV